MSLKHLERGSSAIDWCEDNYKITPAIAEFFNTVSNALFLIVPPMLIHLFKQYSLYINQGVNLIWVLLIVVGVTSMYFHATLSMLGQILDELAILWLVMAAFAMWYPKRLLPMIFKGDRSRFQVIMLMFTIISTGLACMEPAVNSFALMVFGVPATMLLILELRRCTVGRAYRLGIRCGCVWALALFCWVNDRLLCDLWSSLSFPYLHGAWHILIFIAAYTACVLFAYFDAISEYPERFPELRFWPRDNWELGVPYVALRNASGDKSYLHKI